MTNEDLDQIETEVLVDALHRRFPNGCVVLGERRLTKTENGTDIFWRGGTTACMGLLRYGSVKLEDRIRSLRDENDS